MLMQKNTEWAAIGKIVAPFGLRGDLKVVSLSDIPQRFAQLDGVYLDPDYELYAIEGVRPYRGEMLLLKLKGINDATVASTFCNRTLYIPLHELANLPPDSYYQHDILGLQVMRLDDKPVGTIVDIMPTGGHDVYVIKSSAGKQFLIPAVKATIKQIDLIRHIMYIDPIRGLLDDDAVIDEPSAQTEEEEE